MAFLELNGVCKSYGEGAERTDVLSGIDLHVEEGEFICIVGFSGSGKTTLVSTVAGLIQPDQGTVMLKGQPIQGPGPERGGAGYAVGPQARVGAAYYHISLSLYNPNPLLVKPTRP